MERMLVNEQRDLEVLALGAMLCNSSALKAAFEAMSGSDFKEKDVAAVFDEVKRGKSDGLKAWLKRRGTTVNGKAVEAVLVELVQRARKRAMGQTAERLRLAIAAGCEEEVKACLEKLEAMKP